MSTNIVTKTAAFTIADADISAHDSVTYMCTGAFAITIPATGVTAGNQFIIKSTDGLQTFTTTGATVTPPLYMSVELYGDEASVGITCTSIGNYEIVGDLASSVDYLEDKVAFRVAIDTATNSLPFNTNTDITWDEVTYDHGGNFDLTNSWFVAPTTGTYEFCAQMMLDSPVADSTRLDCSFVLNDTDSIQNKIDYAHGNGFYTLTLNDTVDLVKGDTVGVRVFNRHTSADEALYSTVSSQKFSFFTGRLVTSSIVIAEHGVEHSFSVNKTTEGVNQTFPDTNFNKVTWSDVDYSYNAGFDLTNNEFIIPSSGRWEFTAGGQTEGAESSGVAFTLAIYVDGALAKTGVKNRPTGSAPIGTIVSATLDLVAGQKVSIYCQVSNVNMDLAYIATSTWFEGSKVSGTSTGVEYDSYDVSATAYLSASQAVVAANTYEKIEYDFIRHDQGGNFDTTNNRFIAPIDGVYHVSATTRFEEASNASIRTAIYKNGSNVGQLSHDTKTITQVGRSQTLVGTLDIVLKAGDYIEVWGQHSDNTLGEYYGADNSSMYTYISVTLNKATTKAECSFYMYLDTNQTLTTSGAWEKINLNNTLFDYGNNADTTVNNRIDISEDGRYVFNYSVGFNVLTSTTANFVCALWVNDIIAATGNRNAGLASTTLNNISNGSTILDLQKGDYVELYIYQDESNSERARGLDYMTYISGYRLVSSQDTVKLTSDLSDVNTTPAITNDILMHNGTEYAPTQVLNDTNVLYETTLAVATGEVVIPPAVLGGDDYIVEVVGDMSTTASLHLYVNGDNVDANYTYARQYAYDTTTNANDGNTPNTGTFFNYGGGGTSRAHITAFNGKISWEWTCNAATDVDTTRLARGKTIHHAGTTDSTLTSLTLAAENTATFNIGTRIRIINPTSNPITLAPHGVDHYFSVHKDGSDQNITTTAITPVTWSAADSLGTQNVAFDFTNNQFVAPVSGLYYLYTTCQLSSNTAATILHITTTGEIANRHADREFSVSGYQSFSAGGTFYLKAGETAKVEITSSDTNYYVRGSDFMSYFGGYLVSGSSTGVEHDRYEVSFRCEGNGVDQSATGTAYTQVVNLSVAHDRGGNFDTTNARFIAPVSGTYSFQGSAALLGVTTDDDIFLNLYKNGNNFTTLDGTRDGFSNEILSGAVTEYLNAGDYVELWYVDLTTSGAYPRTSVPSYVNFSGHLVQADAKAECSFLANLNQTDDTSSIVAIGDTKIPLSNTEYNYGNAFDTTTSKFTAPEDGRYVFAYSAQIETISTAAEEVIARLFIGGVAKANGSRSDGGGSIASVSSTGTYIADLQKDDEVELYVYQTESTSETISGFNGSTYLSGYRLATTPTTTNTYNPVVWETTIETATDTIDVPTGLLGAMDYRFKLALVNDHASTATVYMYVNGDTTDTNYRSELVYSNASSAVGSGSNFPGLTSVFTNPSVASMEGTITAIDDKLLIAAIGARYKDATDFATVRNIAISNVTTTFSAITAIQLKSSQTTGFGVGTRVRILKG